MHENQWRCRISESVVVNVEAALDGECCVVDFDEIGGKVKRIGFVR